MFKKILISIISFVILSMPILSITNGVRVWIPKRSSVAGSDYNPVRTEIDWNYSVLKIIAFVNKYLRIAIWFVCFLFMIINWFKLISARWDSKTTNEATSALIKSIIWIVVCLLAYIIVNVALRLM